MRLIILFTLLSFRSSAQTFHHRIEICWEYTIVNFAVIPDPDASYQWRYNNVTVDGSSVQITLTDTALFYVVCVATYPSGCEVSSVVKVQGIECSTLFLPNCITVNGDGLNELWMPKYSGDVQIKNILVFDRWGGKVYEGIDGWDGSGCMQGVYNYRLEYYKAGVYSEKYGRVTLVR